MNKTLLKPRESKRKAASAVSRRSRLPKRRDLSIPSSPKAVAENLYRLAYQEATKRHPDYNHAADFLIQAAGLQNAEAIYALATWYLFGRSPIKKDLRRAIELLLAAVRLGNKDAMYDLAVSYERGKGVEKDLHQAFMLYRRAARLGDKKSTFEVGRCLYYGIGVELNRRTAAHWLDKAEELGSYEPSESSTAAGKPTELTAPLTNL